MARIIERIHSAVAARAAARATPASPLAMSSMRWLHLLTTKHPGFVYDHASRGEAGSGTRYGQDGSPRPSPRALSSISDAAPIGGAGLSLLVLHGSRAAAASKQIDLTAFSFSSIVNGSIPAIILSNSGIVVLSATACMTQAQ